MKRPSLCVEGNNLFCCVQGNLQSDVVTSLHNLLSSVQKNVHRYLKHARQEIMLFKPINIIKYLKYSCIFNICV